MEHVLVRYSDIGTKSRHVRNQMRQVLRQRVEDRLEYGGLDYSRVSAEPGRIIVESSESPEVARAVSELPGVASASPAVKTEADLEAMKGASEQFDCGESFGIEANRAGEHGFDSQDIKRELGAHFQELTGAEVDLDEPDTLLEVDVREDDAYLFTGRFQGPGGLPVGTQDPVAMLISGGIDSPVAAFEMMKRGADIFPIYFYNRPIAAEDHLMRFEASLEKLRRFHPGKKWEYYVVDMEEVNQELMELGRGRMVVHRIVMFRAAEKLAEMEGLNGIATGEALGQKSSQTTRNLDLTSSMVESAVFRPLLSWNKEDITGRAREIGTYEEAKIASACRTMAPEQPATRLSEKDFDELRRQVDIDALVETAVEAAEKCTLEHQKD
jgi:thiamine biosynthesis protein ThiI